MHRRQVFKTRHKHDTEQLQKLVRENVEGEEPFVYALTGANKPADAEGFVMAPGNGDDGYVVLVYKESDYGRC